MESTLGEIYDWIKGIKLGYSSTDKFVLFSYIINAIAIILFLVAFCGKEKAAKIILRWPYLVNWIPAKKILVKMNGNLLSLPVTIDYMVLVKSDWEQEERDFASKLSFDNGAIIDIGADVGHYTVLLASKHPKNKVISIEASPSNFPLLKSNCKLNNLTNVVLYNLAIYDKDDTIKEFFERGSLSTMQKQFLQVLNIPSQQIRKEKVRTLTIDRLIEKENLDQVSLLKMDIEGSEILALKGASSALKERTIKNMIIEYHTHSNKTYITNLLKTLGYSYSVHERSIFFETEDFANGHIIATLNELEQN